MVQWLRLCAPNVGSTGLIPGQGTRISHATWRGQNKKREREREGRKGKEKKDSPLESPERKAAVLTS